MAHTVVLHTFNEQDSIHFMILVKQNTILSHNANNQDINEMNNVTFTLAQ
jgi:hypothetical protein